MLGATSVILQITRRNISNPIPGTPLIYSFKKSAAFIFLLGISICNADELSAKNMNGTDISPTPFNLWINPGLVSYHFDRNAGYRGLNWGFGVQSNISEDFSILAGNFINSDRARSNYAALAWQPLTWNSVRMGVVASAFDGYPHMLNGGWFPAMMPWVSIRNDRFGVNLTIVPNYRNRLHGAIAAQFIVRVW